MIFQGFHSSLWPHRNAGGVAAAPLESHGLMPRQEVTERVAELLDRIGLHAGFFDRYPHELSDRQRQRVGIIRALPFSSDLIMCDEPSASSTVSI
jgi:ABC-type oligopeptide transport system ATPase subunit